MGFLVGHAARRASENKPIPIGGWDRVLNPITWKQRRSAEEEEVSDEFCHRMEKTTLRCREESGREEQVKKRQDTEASLQDHEEESAPSIKSPEISVTSPCPSPERQPIDENVTYSHDHHLEVPPGSPNAPEGSRAYDCAAECSEPALNDRSDVRVSKLPPSSEKKKTFSASCLISHSPSEEEYSHKSKGPSEPERHRIFGWNDPFGRNNFDFLCEQREPVVAVDRVEPGNEKGKKNEYEVASSGQWREFGVADSGRPAAQVPTAPPNFGTGMPSPHPVTFSWQPSCVPAYINPFQEHTYNNTCPHLTPFDCDPRSCPTPAPLPTPPPVVYYPNPMLNPTAIAILAMRIRTARLAIPPLIHAANFNPAHQLRHFVQNSWEQQPQSYWPTPEDLENLRLEEEARLQQEITRRQEAQAEQARLQQEIARQQEIEAKQARLQQAVQAQQAGRRDFCAQRAHQRQEMKAEDDRQQQVRAQEALYWELKVKQARLWQDIQAEKARERETQAQPLHRSEPPLNNKMEWPSPTNTFAKKEKGFFFPRF